MLELKTAYLFSGQGAQYNGMGLEFYEAYPIAKSIFEEASDALGTDIKKICFDDDSRLDFTPYTQPAILTVSHAIEQVLKEEGLKPDVVGGLSLGEYTALVSSKVLSFSEAVSLVHQRGTLMEEAVPSGKGKMAAVMGLEASVLEKICEQVSKEFYVSIANYNTPSQLVISGAAKGVTQAVILATEAGAKRAIELNVSGPFHSEMLQPAADLFGEEIKKVAISPFAIPVYSNVTAQIYPGVEDVPSLLTRQISSPVKFNQMVNRMIADGVENFIEVGPGKTLRSFIKSIDRKVNVKSVENISQFNKVVELLK